MRAKATQFNGIIFRSRLEAYMYRYLQLHYKPKIILYEPKKYSTSFYVPDFIVSSDEFHFAVEVKPTIDYANFKKYQRWMSFFTCIEHLKVVTNGEWKSISRDGQVTNDYWDRMTYIQAWNDVKSFINPKRFE